MSSTSFSPSLRISLGVKYRENNYRTFILNAKYFIRKAAGDSSTNAFCKQSDIALATLKLNLSWHQCAEENQIRSQLLDPRTK